MKQSVFGILKKRDDAEKVVDRLKTTGFLPENISLLFPGDLKTEGEEFYGEHGTKAPEGAATGGTTGFVVGGVLGWLAGLGSLAIPGIGPLIAAGPILAALSGAAVGTAIGGVAGALIGLGIPEHEARMYEARLKGGDILVSIHTDSDIETRKAREILKEMHAEEIATSGEAKGVGEVLVEEERMSFKDDPFKKDKLL